MVTIGGQIHPTTGDHGPINIVSGRAAIQASLFHWEGPRATAAKATFTSGAFIQITLSGGNVLGYIEYLVSG